MHHLKDPPTFSLSSFLYSNGLLHHHHHHLSSSSSPMSSPLTAVQSPPSNTTYYLTNLGLGYAIAISLGFLVLLSSILLASYICCRHRNNYNNRNSNTSLSDNTSHSDNGIILPRIIFVAEDDDDGDIESGIVGLEQNVINSYPKFPFVKGGGGLGSDSLCPICLCEYKDAEMLRMLPDCKHYFHLTCIDAWLKLNASCPVCRNSPLPTPLSTPLSELVPLSQYSDGRRRR